MGPADNMTAPGTRWWRKLWWLGAIGLAPLFIPGTAVLRVFLLFFLAPLVGDAVLYMRRRGSREQQRETADADHAGMLWRYHASTMLSHLNPYQLRQMIRQMRGDAVARRRGDITIAEAYTQSIEYGPPFAGEWLVVNGGTTEATSHSWELIAQRFAYDFVIADADGRSHLGAGTQVEQYFCYGRPVLAAAGGEVVDVVDGIRDAPSVGRGWVDWRCRDMRGNSVTIRHAPGEYSFSAHLLAGSIPVRRGQHVRRGELIGLCGNSGHSTEPHLHFQLQDCADFFTAVGLPLRFSAVIVDGEPNSGAVFLQRGARVAPQESGG